MKKDMKGEDFCRRLYFVLLVKSHLQSYPCPLQINSFWNLGFLLGITIILQIITGIFLGLHYTSDFIVGIGNMTDKIQAILKIMPKLEEI